MAINRLSEDRIEVYDGVSASKVAPFVISGFFFLFGVMLLFPPGMPMWAAIFIVAGILFLFITGRRRLVVDRLAHTVTQETISPFGIRSIISGKKEFTKPVKSVLIVGEEEGGERNDLGFEFNDGTLFQPTVGATIKEIERIAKFLSVKVKRVTRIETAETDAAGGLISILMALAGPKMRRH